VKDDEAGERGRERGTDAVRRQDRALGTLKRPVLRIRSATMTEKIDGETR
jgi:hypothetical protein